MSQSDPVLHLCNCNGSIPLDPESLARALRTGSAPPVRKQLCRAESPAFSAAVQGGSDTLVACTQESALFRELSDATQHSGTLRFVNIREAAGWSKQADAAHAKIAGLLAMARLPDPEPIPAVAYRSEGATLIVGPMDAALAWAEEIRSELDVCVLATSARGGTLPLRREFPVYSGDLKEIKGVLGSFEVAWEQANAIDLERCTRCNACVRACPEGAIDYSYQIDADKCRAHRDCVAACGAVGAIDFQRNDRTRRERFDLILDLSSKPHIALPHPPEGYFAPGKDPLDQSRAVHQLLKRVGEFEKPTYSSVREKLCAHGRNQIAGCTRCIDVCSASAIESAGDHVRIDPARCAGCGGCATVCPTGAIRYQYPRVPDLGVRLKVLLSTYREAGGRDACVLFHREQCFDALIGELARRGDGLPARVIPLPVHDVASIGLDVLLGAICYGASQCAILMDGSEPESYREATGQQLRVGQTILGGLGYGGGHLRIVEAADWRELGDRIWRIEPARTVERAAGFNFAPEKRTTLDFALDHLARLAPAAPESIELEAGAPFGQVLLDKARCTMCMSCVGACPAKALADSPEHPRIRFIERNCVQCGLCVKTCPEDALSLSARLLVGDAARRERLLNEAEPFNCVRCGKPFGTRQMIDNMVGKLSGHSMFASAPALRRLQMCADCRVADMMENRNEMSVFDVNR